MLPTANNEVHKTNQRIRHEHCNTTIKLLQGETMKSSLKLQRFIKSIIYKKYLYTGIIITKLKHFEILPESIHFFAFFF